MPRRDTYSDVREFCITFLAMVATSVAVVALILRKRYPVTGKRVRVKNTLFYNGQTGILIPASTNPEDFWDYNVILNNGRRIGVTKDQIEEEV